MGQIPRSIERISSYKINPVSSTTTHSNVTLTTVCSLLTTVTVLSHCLSKPTANVGYSVVQSQWTYIKCCEFSSTMHYNILHCISSNIIAIRQKSFVIDSTAASAFNEFTRTAINGHTELMSLLETQDVAASSLLQTLDARLVRQSVTGVTGNDGFSTKSLFTKRLNVQFVVVRQLSHRNSQQLTMLVNNYKLITVILKIIQLSVYKYGTLNDVKMTSFPCSWCTAFSSSVENLNLNR